MLAVVTLLLMCRTGNNVLGVVHNTGAEQHGGGADTKGWGQVPWQVRGGGSTLVMGLTRVKGA